MKEFSVFDKNFTATKLSSYNLLIKFDSNGISYAIADTFRKIYLSQVRYNFKERTDFFSAKKAVEEIFSKDPYFTKKYKTVYFIFASERYTIVPKEFFDKKIIKTLFEQNFEVSDKEEIHFNELKQNLYNLFSIPSELLVFLIDKIPEINFFNHISVLLNYALAQKISIVNFEPGLLDIIIVENGNLKYLNSFNFTTYDDAVYILSSVLKQLNIPNSSAEMFLTGDFEENTEHFDFIKTYFPKMRPLQSYPYNYSFTIPKHFLASMNLAVLL